MHVRHDVGTKYRHTRNRTPAVLIPAPVFYALLKCSGGDGGGRGGRWLALVA
jgi:hypothetical protein